MVIGTGLALREHRERVAFIGGMVGGEEQSGGLCV